MERQVDPYYKTRRWLKKRQKILRRDGYQCQESKRYGKNVPAEMVHHIFPRDQYPEYEWEDWNLISLSQAEHNRMHNRESNALSQKGIDLMNRTKRRLVNEGKWKDGPPGIE